MSLQSDVKLQQSRQGDREKNGFDDIKSPLKKTSDCSFIHDIQSTYTIQKAKIHQRKKIKIIRRSRKKH